MKLGSILALAVLATAVSAPTVADELVIGRPALGFAGPLDGMTAGFEAATGDKIKIAGPNETPDLVVLMKFQVEELVKTGKVDTAGVTDIAAMRIGLAVKAGAPVPDISTPDKLKQVLLAAKSVGVSRFASGQFVTTELFPNLGIADQMKSKTVAVGGVVGEGVAKGEVEMGFQQMSELLPVKGISVVGRIPPSVQRVTILTAGVSPGTKASAAVQRFIAYVKSPAVVQVYKALYLEQVK